MDSTMNNSQTQKKVSTRHEPRSNVPTSGDGAPASDTGDSGQVSYEDLFGTPALDDEAEHPERRKIEARKAGRDRGRELVKMFGDEPQSLMAGLRQGLRIQYGIREMRAEGGGEER